MQKAVVKKREISRFLSLDVLRGYFVLVIIIDHLNRFPSWFAWITGQGRLWVSAGEGFFIISGLLVGYTRGHKKLHLPMKEVIQLLYKRAFVLYLCAIIASALLLVMTLQLSFQPGMQPAVVVPKHSLSAAIYQLLTLQFVFEWVYFLKFYIASMLIAPVFIWLFRHGKTVLGILVAIAIWAFGYTVKQDWLQWQILFFIPAAFGFHLETIRSYWRSLSGRTRRSIEAAAIVTTTVALALSSFWVFGWRFVKRPDFVLSFDEYLRYRQTIDPIFQKVQLSLGRIILAFVVFVGLYVIVNKGYSYIARYLDWLLVPFGRSSLTIYILHGFILVFAQSFVPLSTSSLFNTVLTAGIVLAIYVLSRLAIIQKFIPR